MSKSSGEAASQYVQNTTNIAQQAFSSVPIVPLAGGQSISSLQRAKQNKLNSLNDDFKDSKDVTNLQNKVNRLLGIDEGISSSELREMSRLAGKDNDFLEGSSRFLGATKKYLSDIKNLQLRNESEVLQQTNTWFLKNKDAIARHFRTKKNNRRVATALKNSDAKTIQEFANSLRNESIRKDFLTWLHGELGGKQDQVRTYDDFVSLPLT